jgi:hypothetical protein
MFGLVDSLSARCRLRAVALLGKETFTSSRSLSLSVSFLRLCRASNFLLTFPSHPLIPLPKTETFMIFITQEKNVFPSQNFPFRRRKGYYVIWGVYCWIFTHQRFIDKREEEREQKDLARGEASKSFWFHWHSKSFSWKDLTLKALDRESLNKEKKKRGSVGSTQERDLFAHWIMTTCLGIRIHGTVTKAHFFYL